ncbi:MAG: 3-oxoacyl-ACP reductase FabG [Oscillospiraceae bacterium]|nr:3-oxoacyl-ACP reductase FabG [Oscillospiraceae bacterium]
MWLAKTVLITGASRGIGAATAEIFADNGYNVIINYNKNHERAKQIASKTGGNLIQADVSDIAQTEKMIDSIISEYGKIDVLVNNAGISVTGTFDSISDEDARRLFDVNIFGTFNCTKLVLTHMLRRKYGKIINVSSMWGQVGASCEVHYSASKSAVIGFTKALAKEVGPSGITVNCVSPGFISTDMTACYTKEEVNAICEEIPVGRTGSPYEVAQAVFYLASEQAAYITGQVLGINGGMIV